MKKILLSLVASMFTAASVIAVPQAIVFDFGGVLTGKPNREVVVSFIQDSLHLSKEKFEEVNQEKRRALKQGKTDEDFWVSYAQSQGIELPSDWTESFRAALIESIGVNPEMYVL